MARTFTRYAATGITSATDGIVYTVGAGKIAKVILDVGYDTTNYSSASDNAMVGSLVASVRGQNSIFNQTGTATVSSISVGKERVLSIGGSASQYAYSIVRDPTIPGNILCLANYGTTVSPLNVSDYIKWIGGGANTMLDSSSFYITSMKNEFLLVAGDTVRTYNNDANLSSLLNYSFMVIEETI